jgi:hypothetical protein
MPSKPNKYLEKIRMEAPLEDAEAIIGAFMGRTPIVWGWFLLLGPLAFCTMKQYQVIVTDKRVIFGKLSFIGSLTTIDQFAFKDIQGITLRRGMLAYKIGFYFNNGRRLILHANHKAVRATEGFLFDENLGAYLQKAVA